MDNPRAEKVAVVDEVRQRLDGAGGALITEYRGLNVAAMAQLRRALREAGGDFKIYKNTLVRFAARDLGLELDEMLTGPTAIAFVEGDPVNVAKALRDFARTNPALVVKGGLLGEKLLDADGARALAEVEPREVLLARLAGAMAAPMQQFAGLLSALPRNLAYGLKALIDQRGGLADIPADDEAEAGTEAVSTEPETAPAPAEPDAAAPADVETAPAGTETAPADTETAPADTEDPVETETAPESAESQTPPPAPAADRPETTPADPAELTLADAAEPTPADSAETETAAPAETEEN